MNKHTDSSFTVQVVCKEALVLVVIPADGRSVRKPFIHSTHEPIGLQTCRLPYNSLETSIGWLWTTRLLCNSLKARNSIPYICCHHNLFPLISKLISHP